jgi:hypothetical protein
VGKINLENTKKSRIFNKLKTNLFMKNILLILGVLITTNVFGQKFQKLEVNTGISLFTPVSKDFSWNEKAWGQRVQFVKSKDRNLAYVLNFGIQQNNDKYLQIPTLLGLRHFMYKNIYITYGTGATFFKNENTRFTITAGWGVQMKKFVIEQSVFRTTIGQNIGKSHENNVGISVLYRL